MADAIFFDEPQGHTAARPLLRLGCEMRFWFPEPTALIAMVNVHRSRTQDLIVPDRLVTSPRIAAETYFDVFGNQCVRMVAERGELTIGTDGLIRDDCKPDAVDWDAVQHEIGELPSEVLQFLLPSRYCDSELISDEACRRFGNMPRDARRVQAVCDFVHHHLTFDYKRARPTRTAYDALGERTGVCRDFTHLAIAMCRSLSIPARYCSGFISDVGVAGPYPPMDFCAWMEVYLEGRWWTFDPRNNKPMRGRVLCSFGRDAADVPLTHTFGWHALNSFKVWIDQVGGNPEAAQAPEASLAGNPTRKPRLQTVPGGRQ